MKKKIEIEVFDIDVDERYYSFTYKVWEGPNKCRIGYYSNDYQNGDTPKEFKKHLEKEAWKIVLSEI